MNLENRREIIMLKELGDTLIIAIEKGDWLLIDALEQNSLTIIENLLYEGFTHEQIVLAIKSLTVTDDPKFDYDKSNPNNLLMDWKLSSGHRIIIKSIPIVYAIDLIVNYRKQEMLSQAEYKGILFKILHCSNSDARVKVKSLLDEL